MQPDSFRRVQKELASRSEAHTHAYTTRTNASTNAIDSQEPTFSLTMGPFTSRRQGRAQICVQTTCATVMVVAVLGTISPKEVGATKARPEAARPVWGGRSEPVDCNRRRPHSSSAMSTNLTAIMSLVNSKVPEQRERGIALLERNEFSTPDNAKVHERRVDPPSSEPQPR